ncbi:MAG: hypothetical protein ACO1OQ_02925 [Rufibacter sp.]
MHPLYTIWQPLAQQYTGDTKLIERWWLELEKAYTSSGRHYHNLTHISAMLLLAQEHATTLASPALVQFAIFYHDAVYKATIKDNEEKSAALAEERLTQLGLGTEDIEKVAAMILATKKHQVSPDPDTNFLLDFDLAILGADWPQYEQYTRQIRKEYRIYPDLLYKPGRKQVLRHFLDLPQIFKTAKFQELLEGKARQNLARELTEL